MSARLGPFSLDSVLGRGGMGVVWRGVHLEQGVPVAVKVDLHAPAPESTAAFLHEVQIVAALDHPNVVMVLDHGVVDEATQRATGGELRTGARWLAMELAGGGSPAERAPATWAEVRHVARGLLDGLGHAHARGVIHRDIKPGNLLFAGDEASVATVPAGILDSRVVLSDFGISERRDHTALRTEDSVGTPQYMAPELIEARFRDQGPWTDLYAVGILLWKLTTGGYPFRGTNAFQIFRQHLYDRPGRFEPTMAVPEGLEPLIRTLLGKAPGDRPSFSAEVRRGIDALEEPVIPGISAPRPVDEDEVTQALPSLTSGRSYAARPRTRTAAPPLLHDGRRRNVQLHGAGLALYGLRTVPLVGREAVCDRLWNALVAVRTEGRARAVVIRGPSGIGKSRVADWVATRAHELGVAGSLRAVNLLGGAPGAGLVGMLARELGTDGLDRHDITDRLDPRFPDGRIDRGALGRLLGAGGPAPTGGEARQLVLSVLAELAHDRCLVVSIEDAHLDVEALELADHLLSAQGLRPTPILLLLTVRDEDLVDHPDSADLLTELAEDPALEQLPLGPLDPTARRQLVRGMLGLTGALAQEVEDRTAGNPLFASQVIGAWVEQGVLLPSPGGFRLAEGRPPTFPDDLAAVWRVRLDAALAGRSAEAIEALELAATFAGTVDQAAWAGACALLELDVPHRLFDDLLKRHLVHAEDAGTWRFAHGLVRDVLIERSKGDQVWRDHNLAAAVHLRERPGGARAAELARHLLEAEVWDEAVEPLFTAVADQIDTGDLRSARWIDRLEGALDRLGFRAPHPLRARLGVLKANRHRARGELADAERYAEDAVSDALSEGWTSEAPRALREAARVLFARAAFDRALARAREAEQGFLAVGDRLRAADCSYTIAEILSTTGHPTEASERFQRCAEVFRVEGPEFLHQPLLGLAMLEHRRGDLDATAARIAACRSHAEPLGLQWTLANCANLEGELARAAGDLDGASAHYREAADRYRALESPDFVFPLLNLGILDVGAGRWDAAIGRLQALFVHLKRHPNALVDAYAQMVCMVAYAGLGQQQPAGDALGRLASYVSGSGLVDGDIAALAEQAGTLMQAAGWTEDARRALRLAEAQYRACDRPEDVARVRTLVHR